jgi:hypothetical protein
LARVEGDRGAAGAHSRATVEVPSIPALQKDIFGNHRFDVAYCLVAVLSGRGSIPVLSTVCRGFSLPCEAGRCMVSDELSLYWSRRRILFDGPRMRHQSIRISTIT